MASLEELIANAVIDTLKKQESDDVIKIGVSARHVHLSEKDLYALFGEGYQLTKKKELMGGQFAAEEWVTIVSCVISTISTGITLYLKNYNLNDLIRQLHVSANEAWLIREDYISLLTDFNQLQDIEITTKREELKLRVYELYKNSPKTDSKSYELAQKALKKDEEQFFTADEIDKMLLQHLRH